ncbi:MAG: hypothetical protein HY293_21600 [Planctomycetes bacterium]|nr:hypothetical protein [Planctomycetota bacterium]
MLLDAAFAALLMALPVDPEPLVQDLGEKKVTMKEAWFVSGPNWRSKPLRKAEDGEDVTVTAVEGKYSKVTAKKDNLAGYIESTALIAPEKFNRSAADEKEGQKLAAQGLEGQKGLNPDTEKEYRSQGGASRDQAYKDLDAWLLRPAYSADRASLVDKLKQFQQEGKLGESSPVK